VGVDVGMKPTARAVLKIPGEGRKLDVLVVSDGYVGMEWRVMGVQLPLPPVVDDDEKKEGGAVGSGGNGSGSGVRG